MSMRCNQIKYFVGIDVSKAPLHYCIREVDSANSADSQLTMRKDGFNDLKQILSNYDERIVAIESTLSYRPFGLFLSFKPEVFLIKHFTQTMTLRKTKTDKADAHIIAQFVWQNHQYLYYFQSHDYDGINNLASAREDLSKQIAKTKTQLKQQINIVFPDLISKFNIFTTTALEVLSQFPTARIINTTDTKLINESINKVGAGVLLSLLII